MSLFVRRRCTHRGASVDRWMCIGRPPARHERNFFLLHSQQLTQKENHGKSISGGAKINVVPLRTLTYLLTPKFEGRGGHPEAIGKIQINLLFALFN
mgnify:CR=1 FL=1